MGWMVPIIVGALVMGAAAGRKRTRAVRRPSNAPPPADQLDQLEQLRRHGTSDDAARLIAEGRGDELAGLGYRPD